MGRVGRVCGIVRDCSLCCWICWICWISTPDLDIYFDFDWLSIGFWSIFG